MYSWYEFNQTLVLFFHIYSIYSFFLVVVNFAWCPHINLLMVRIPDILKSNLLYERLKVKFILKMTLQLWDSWALSIKRANEKSPLLSFSYGKPIFAKYLFTILIKVMLQRFLESPFQKYNWFWLGNMTRRIPLEQAKVFQISTLTISLINCTKPNKMNVSQTKLRVLHEWIWPNLVLVLC